MSALRNEIARLASEFADAVLTELSRASLSELSQLSTQPTATRPASTSGRPAASRVRRSKKGGQRSTKDLDGTVSAIVGALRGASGGMRSEHLQSALRLSNRDLARPLQTALARRAIRKTGVRRGTTYFAV